MKSLIIKYIGLFFSYIYPLKLANFFSCIYKYLYTGYYSRFFAEFGKTSIINPKFLLLEGPEFIHIGENAFIGSRVQLTAWKKIGEQSFTPEIHIGNGSSIGDDSHVTAINKIWIGNGVRSGKKILITDNAHGASSKELLEISPILRPLVSKGPVIIEDNVWLGEKVSIMPGVHIGRGAIIGSNSVVTRDIPANSVAAGSPAKVVKIME